MCVFECRMTLAAHHTHQFGSDQFKFYITTMTKLWMYWMCCAIVCILYAFMSVVSFGAAKCHSQAVITNIQITAVATTCCHTICACCTIRNGGEQANTPRQQYRIYLNVGIYPSICYMVEKSCDPSYLSVLLCARCAVLCMHCGDSSRDGIRWPELSMRYTLGLGHDESNDFQ